jgi:hypothetical protein
MLTYVTKIERKMRLYVLMLTSKLPTTKMSKHTDNGEFCLPHPDSPHGCYVDAHSSCYNQEVPT